MTNSHRAKEVQRKALQDSANKATPEQLENQLQMQLKSLNSALLVNHDKLIKYHSENVVILNRKLQQKKGK